MVLNIISIYLKEKGKLIRGGEAYVYVQFLREKDGLYGKVFETRAFTESVSEIGKDIFTTHERRIRIVINECLKQLKESQWAERKPDFVSEFEIKQEASAFDTLSKKLSDTTGFFTKDKKEELKAIQLSQIQYKKGFVPTFRLGDKKKHQLWAFKSQFKQSNDPLTQKLFIDYKAKFRLTFCTLVIGAALVAISLNTGSFSEDGMPNLSLLVPGAVFTLCSVPIYIKTNKLARRTVEQYNKAILDK